MQVGEELADQVWEAWDMGEFDSCFAGIAWIPIASIFSAERPYRMD
jgi:hypothetical protein